MPNDAPPTAPVAAQSQAPGGMDFDSMPDDSQQYDNATGKIKAFGQGAAEGIAGPLVPLAERALDISPQEVRGPSAVNPISHGLGEATGLVASSLTGVGEGAIMSGAGHLAADAVGLGNVAKDARLSYKIGSEAVKQAAEMAVLQSSDEASKMILKDPETSTESAIANVGLAAAMGGAGGAAFGAISPLWSATGGKALDTLFNGVKNYWNGGTLELPEHLATAFKDLNIEPSPLMTSALSGDAKSVERFQNLYRAEHPEIMEELKTLPDTLQKSVTDAMGINLNDTLHFSNDKSGEALRNEFNRVVKEEYDPLAARFEAQDAENAKAPARPDLQSAAADKVREQSLTEDVGPSSPNFKEFETAAKQITEKKTVGGLHQLSKDLGDTAYAAMKNDPVKGRALYSIKDIVDESVADHLEKAGVEAAGKEGGELAAQKVAEMQANKKDYAAYSQKYTGLLDFLGMSRFKGTGNMTKRIEGLTNEQLLSKLMAKGDVQGQKYMGENFPKLAEMAQKHESNAFLAKSVDQIEGKTSLDVNHLSERLASLKSTGHPEYANYVVPPAAQAKIESAKQIGDALKNLKNVKNSGTPAGMAKVFRGAGSSALAGVATVLGHNPISAYLIGEISHHVGKTIPEAVQLGMLKYMGSGQPVKAEGFKAMVDMIHQTIKGENMLAKSTQAVFKAGAQVTAVLPDQDMRDKLDKKVTKLQDTPGKTTQLADGSNLGHYMPDHQAALTQAQVRATQYLQSIKPQPYQPSPMDKPIDPTPAKVARYNRALDIASSPAIVLQHVKDGTLQSSDIQDLHSMYPALAKNMAQKLSNEMIKAQESGQEVPYRTKVGLAMFLGQHLDSTMSPSSIVAAQPQPSQAPPQPGRGSKMKGGAKTATTMNKNAESYRTGPQAGEASHTSRD